MIADKPREWTLVACLVALIALTAIAALASGCQPLPAPSALSPLFPSPGVSGSRSLTIVHTNDTWGYLTPCG
jgi:hypothetical protein